MQEISFEKNWPTGWIHESTLTNACGGLNLLEGAAD